MATVSLALAAGTLGTTGATASPAAPGEDDPFRPQLVTVETLTPSDKELLQTLGLDLTEHAGREYVEVVLHTHDDLDALEAAGFDFDVRIADMLARNIEIAQINDAYRRSVNVSSLPSGRTEYRDLVDYNSEMAQMAKARKNLVKRFKLKRPSLDGRSIYGVEIGKNVRRKLAGQPTFLLMGVHHAREWPSGEMAMEFAVDLAKSYGKDKRITGLLNQARVIVVPVVNPDGFTFSRQDGDLIDLRGLNEIDPLEGSTSILGTPGRAYMRKNCRLIDGRDTPDGTCEAQLATPGGFGLGTDLNRNYGGLWGGPGAAGANPGDQADPTYRGAKPFSEPETLNIRDLVRTRQTTMVISNHTFSNLILRPNGVNPTTIFRDGKPVGNAPDEEALKSLGAKFGAATGYANIHGWELYDTTGTTEDYTYNATGGFGYTMEIGPNEFHPPYPQVVSEYRGAGQFSGKGLRSVYLDALTHAIDRDASGLLKFKGAPKGARLKLAKAFRTPTWEGSFADFVRTKVQVPGKKVSKKKARRTGKKRTRQFNWLVNPSTRPIVRPRTYQELNKTPFATKSYTSTAPAPTGSNDHEFTINKAAAQIQVALDWPTPDDLDLEVYRKEGDQLVAVGTSGNSPGEKELVTLVDQPAGTYVMRVINFAAVTPEYTVSSTSFDATTKQTSGTLERYTLTCARPNGKVVQRKKILIGRGQTKTVKLNKCAKRF